MSPGNIEISVRGVGRITRILAIVASVSIAASFATALYDHANNSFRELIASVAESSSQKAASKVKIDTPTKVSDQISAAIEAELIRRTSDSVYKSVLATSQNEFEKRKFFAVNYDSAAIKAAIDSAAESQVADLNRRIIEIEKKFPAESAVDRYASVNDAIFSKSLENIDYRIKKIEADMISPLIVTTIVFGVIGAIAAVTSIVIAIVFQIKRKAS